MLKHIQIDNYKSIETISFEPGRLNIFIGENGAGKSNILEAIVLAGAAQADKLDNEFLASRGIRVSSPELMRSAFRKENQKLPISITIETSHSKINYSINNDNKPYSSWEHEIDARVREKFSRPSESLKQIISSLSSDEREKFIRSFIDEFNSQWKAKSAGQEINNISITLDIPDTVKRNAKFFSDIQNFIIYSPDTRFLRTFHSESQIEPLGINGEGLYKLLSVMSASRSQTRIQSIKDNLGIFSWFDGLQFSNESRDDRIQISDKFLYKESRLFDQVSANEGFLFALFYFTLFISSITPKIFAIENIENSLNPKLCTELIRRISYLSKSHRKQVFITTHNPAVLDGIDLNDPTQRLFIVSRSQDGRTKLRRFSSKLNDGHSRRLSELFISGALGGIPKGF